MVVDAFLLNYALLNTMKNTRILGFEYGKELYVNNFDFGKIYNAFGHSTFVKFYSINDYLFKDKRLCIPTSS